MLGTVSLILSLMTVDLAEHAQQDSLLLSQIQDSVPARSASSKWTSLSLPTFQQRTMEDSLTGGGLFGGRSFHLRLSGVAELSPLIRRNHTDNPLLPEEQREKNSFGLQPRLQLRADASIGRKLRLQAQYNTDSPQADLQRSFRIEYRGDSSELIRQALIGTFAYTPTNSLMGTSRQMTGFKTELQRGAWRLRLFADRGDALEPTRAQAVRQRQSFTLRSSDYDARRHFFLGTFFREHYDRYLSERPNIASGIRILRIEVWVTRKGGATEQARHGIAWSDLGEQEVQATGIQALGTADAPPRNEANDIPSLMAGMQGVSTADADRQLALRLRSGLDYEAHEYLQLLRPEEYVVNSSLGYISLVRPLEEGESLAVSYEYSYQGHIYKVGDLSAERAGDDKRPLMLRLLYGRQDVATAPYWSNMMRQVYALAPDVSSSLSADDLQLSLSYQPEGASEAINYIPRGALQGKRLIEILDADKLDPEGGSRSDGRFDLIEGQTYNARYGWLFFPTISPFDQTIGEQGGEESLRFPELYSRPIDQAQALSHKDRYRITGSYIQESLAGTQEPKPSLSVDRQTTLGMELSLQALPSLSLGLSWTYLWTQSDRSRIGIGQEPLRNTLWGLHAHWKVETPWLLRGLQQLAPHLKAPSSFSLSGEWAYLQTNYNQTGYYQGDSYLESFEDSYQAIDLLSPEAWTLASVPTSLGRRLGMDRDRAVAHRAHLSWFSIDPVLTRRAASSSTELSSPYVREITTHELYPERQLRSSAAHVLPTLSLRYYPRERGMYNVEAVSLDREGLLSQPVESWAGIQRALPLSNLEAQNVEYLEFWLLDPFLEATESRGGELILQLGDISEDVLPDGRRAMEQSLPAESASSSSLIETSWGRISEAPVIGHAFSGSRAEISRQDVGYDGLSSSEEQQYGRYRDYVTQLRTQLKPERRQQWESTTHNPLVDPAGDDFRHYLDPYYDAHPSSILERYKYYNGVEGNSSVIARSARLSPDDEDINQDNHLNRDERYYEYRLELKPHDAERQAPYVTATRESLVRLPDGSERLARWYQYRVPLSTYTSVIGGIKDFRSIRFMRLILQGFEETSNIRLASFRLVKGSWRQYLLPLEGETSVVGELQTGSISLEEHSSRKPINYVLPPERERSRQVADLEQGTSNEQALSMRVEHLPSGSTRAIYKQGHYDLRAYKRLQMYIHAEDLNQQSMISDNDVSLFLRLGSDLTHNYYEYRLPLKLTPEGLYSSTSPSDRAEVWSMANKLDLDLTLLPLLKEERRRSSQYTSTRLYTKSNPNHPQHSYAVLGNPSLGNIRNIMIGLRNDSGDERSIEVWIDALRLGEPLHEGDWAVQAQALWALSSLGQLRLELSHLGAGFGTIDKPIDRGQASAQDRLRVSADLDLGELLPPRLKSKIPISYKYEESSQTPLYNPFEGDVKLEQTSGDIQQIALTKRRQTTIDLSGLNLGIRSSRPMPYDPANLRIDYNYYKEEEQNPLQSRRWRSAWQLGLNYNYQVPIKPISPFSHLKSDAPWKRYWQQYKLELWPRTIALQSLLSRTSEEETLRAVYGQVSSASLPTSQLDQYLWRRKLNLSWYPMPALALTLTAGTDARIEAPEEWLDRQLNPNGDELWQRAIRRSLQNLGTPYRYSQLTTASYTLPTSHFPRWSWISGTMSHTGTYEWIRGSVLRVQMPHTLSSQRQGNISLQFNLARLYQTLKWKSGSPLWRSLRDVSLSYQTTSSLYLPGYLSDVGNAFGQSSVDGVLRPGLAFALGLADEAFIEQSLQAGLLSTDSRRAFSALATSTKALDLRLGLQPVKGLSITLLMNHAETQRRDFPYLNASEMSLRGGDMQMTTIGLSSLWLGSSEQTARGARVLSRLREKQEEVRSELLSSLSSYVAQPEEVLSLTNPAVLLPAFRRSYMLQAHGLEAIPSKLLMMLPNWNVTYILRDQWPAMRKYISSLSLRHAYRGIYRTHAYDERLAWQRIAGTPLARETAVPSRVGTLEDVSTVSLTETFYPLLGADLNFKGGLSLTGQWRRTHTLSLGVSAARLIESLNNEWSIGLAYRLQDIRQLWHPARKYKTSGQGLILKLDYSSGKTFSRIYMLSSNNTQIALGNINKRWTLSADYEISRLISLRGFYEWQYSEPLVSGALYPSSLHSYGLTVRLSLGN